MQRLQGALPTGRRRRLRLPERHLLPPSRREECSHTGYASRTAISEVLYNNDEIRAALQTRMTAREIREVAVRSGMRPFHANAFDKVGPGLTSLEEVKPYLSPT